MGELHLSEQSSPTTPAANNVNLHFSATPALAWKDDAGNVRTLDIQASKTLTYEEGTFTPSFSSTGATFSYTTQTGNYTVIGRMVFFDVYILLSGAPGGTTTNAVVIDGLPYTAASWQHYSVPIGQFTTLDVVAANAVQVSAMVLSGTTTIWLYELIDNSGAVTVKASALGSNASIRVAGHYRK